MKKTLLIIGLTIVALVVVIGVWDRISGNYADRMEAQKFYQQSRENSANNAKYNTSLSYTFNGSGAVVTSPASPRIEWKINGSDQPLRGKAPLSFTLSWKIDPTIELEDCEVRGPNVRIGYIGDIWGFEVAEYSSASDFIEAHGGYEGSLEFKDVVPGSLGSRDEPSSAPLYNGVASFNKGWNSISISCVKDIASGLYDEREVSVWIDDQ